MRLRRSVGPSLRALFAHKVRAMLALASVSVGVAAVVLTSAIGTGARREIVRNIERMGPNVLIVRPAQVRRLVARKEVRGIVRTLDLDDYDAIADLPRVPKSAPGIEGVLRVRGGAVTALTKVLGTTSAFPSVRYFRVETGRFFDAGDDRDARRVAVLGARVRDALFGQEDPIGRQVRVRGVPFDVIGVLEAKGVLADGSDEDNQIIVPIRTALRRVFNATWLNTVFVSVDDPANIPSVEADIGRLLRARHGADDFGIQNTARTLAMQQQAAGYLTLLTTGLAALALAIGGAGILGLMLLSVKERTSEIGLRVAVGATPRNIIVQFLLEATLLAVGGWCAGAAAGSLAALVVSAATGWPAAVPLIALAASFAMAVTIGLGFGAFPARKASLVPPIQALLTR